VSQAALLISITLDLRLGRGPRRARFSRGGVGGRPCAKPRAAGAVCIRDENRSV